MLVTSTSKHQDDAFLVISEFLSDEVQTARSRDAGTETVLKKQSVKDQFMKGLDYAAGKNIGAFFKLSAAVPGEATIYDYRGIYNTNTGLIRLLQKAKDINTALRDAEDQTNKEIQEIKSGGK
jgi:multiple sugar transport system substrate-binding protein